MSLGDGIMHRAKPVAENLGDDYFLIIKRCWRSRRVRRPRWTWEIRRRSKPVNVKYDGDEYRTAQDARLAGETALKDLLNNLSQGPLVGDSHAN
jgi:hypothetical protein